MKGHNVCCNGQCGKLSLYCPCLIWFTDCLFIEMVLCEAVQMRHHKKAVSCIQVFQCEEVLMGCHKEELLMRCHKEEVQW